MRKIVIKRRGPYLHNFLIMLSSYADIFLRPTRPRYSETRTCHFCLNFDSGKCTVKMFSLKYKYSRRKSDYIFVGLINNAINKINIIKNGGDISKFHKNKK